MGSIHQPCPDCLSHDALQINDDGSTYCHSCTTFHPPSDTLKEEIPSNFLKGKPLAIQERKIESNACQKYKYMTGEYKGKEVHIATYRDFDGTPVFQKIRIVSEKKFFTIGTFKPLLYGAHLFKGRSKKIIITEGEIDTLSIYQVIGDYPVVSVPNGAQAAKEAIKYNLEFLEKFDEVLFMFDSDKYGIEAAKECASLISIGKAKTVTLPLKDANEMLKAGRTKELYKATWEGTEYRPDGIVSGEELWEEVTKPIEEGLSYPFPMLTYLTYGIRIPEFICFGAGTGIGKTDLFKEIETHLVTFHKQKIGIIHLEESTKDTVLGLMTKYSGIKFHLPDTKYTQEEKRKAFDETVGTNRVFIYDNFGTTDLFTVKNNISTWLKEKAVNLYSLTISRLLGTLLKTAQTLTKKCETLYLNLLTLHENSISRCLEYRTCVNPAILNRMRREEEYALMICMGLKLFLNGPAMYLAWSATNRQTIWKQTYNNP